MTHFTLLCNTPLEYFIVDIQTNPRHFRRHWDYPHVLSWLNRSDRWFGGSGVTRELSMIQRMLIPKSPSKFIGTKMPTSSKTMVFYGWKLVELYPRGLDNWGLGVTFTCRDKCRLNDIELDSLTWLIVMYLWKKYDDLVWRFSPFVSACSILMPWVKYPTEV